MSPRFDIPRAVRRLAVVAVVASCGLLSGLGQTFQALSTPGLSEPYSLAPDVNNYYYITDGANNRIARYSVDTTTITNLAGNAAEAPGFKDGKGIFARFYSPQGIVALPLGQGLLVSDAGNHALRKVSFAGEVTTFAGGVRGFEDGTGLAAKFRAPAGLSVDSAGNVYVADLQNNAVRKVTPAGVVTTLATNLLRPSAVAFSTDGKLYIADTGNNCLRVLTDLVTVRQSAALIAGGGTRDQFGYKDSPFATEGLMDHPNSLLWLGGSVGLLVGDSGNQLIRRFYYSASLGTNSLDTYGPSVGVGFGSITGMARDNEGSLVAVDLASDRVWRMGSATAVQVPVTNPQIGVILMTNIDTSVVSRLYQLTNAVFNNDVVIGILAEDATQTYYNLAPTDSPDGVPDPTASSASPPAYHDGLPALPASIIDPVQADVTIKAVSTQIDRRPSAIVTARVRFQAANPTISGVHPSSIEFTSTTLRSEMWYTVDGTTPEQSGGTSQRYTAGTKLNLLNGTNDVLVKVRAFRTRYASSGVVQKLFTYSDFSKLEISRLGFTRDYHASPGALVVLPVETRLTLEDRLLTLQYRAEVAPVGSAPAITDSLKLLYAGGNDLVSYPSASGVPTSTTTYRGDVVGRPGAVAGLGVAYIGAGSLPQIEGAAVVTLLALQIPPTAKVGDVYQLSVLEASGTPDGGQSAVTLGVLTNHTLTIGDFPLLLGDTALARGYNVEDFGDGVLANNDVNNAFYTSLGVRRVFPGTDLFEAMDAFPLDAPGIVGGDGQIRFLDWQMLLQRSLKLRGDNWLRARVTGGARVSTSTTLQGAGVSPATELSGLVPSQAVVWSRDVRVRGGEVESAHPGARVRMPVNVELVRGGNLSGFQFWPVVSSSATATESAVPVTFAVNSALGCPPPSAHPLPSGSGTDTAFVWDLGMLSPTLKGTNLLGWIEFTLPASAKSGSRYWVRFANADGAPLEQSLYGFETIPGAVWVDVAAAEALPATSEEWRMNFFGSISGADAMDTADPDSDGLTNAQEYGLGLDPRGSDLRLKAVLTSGGVRLHWYGSKGRKYTVLTSLDLLRWQESSNIILGQDAEVDVDAPSEGGAGNGRFFRIVLLP